MKEKRNMVFMKRKALVLLCMGMILTGMTGCSAGIRIAESTQDNIMVIMENPADGSAAAVKKSRIRIYLEQQTLTKKRKQIRSCTGRMPTKL